MLRIDVNPDLDWGKQDQRFLHFHVQMSSGINEKTWSWFEELHRHDDSGGGDQKLFEQAISYINIITPSELIRQCHYP